MTGVETTVASLNCDPGQRAGEKAVGTRDLDWTMVRLPSLGSGNGTRAITLLTSAGGSGRIVRVDVAKTVAAALAHDNTIRQDTRAVEWGQPYVGGGGGGGSGPELAP